MTCNLLLYSTLFAAQVGSCSVAQVNVFPRASSSSSPLHLALVLHCQQWGWNVKSHPVRGERCPTSQSHETKKEKNYNQKKQDCVSRPGGSLVLKHACVPSTLMGSEQKSSNGARPHEVHRHFNSIVFINTVPLVPDTVSQRCAAPGASAPESRKATGGNVPGARHCSLHGATKWASDKSGP